MNIIKLLMVSILFTILSLANNYVYDFSESSRIKNLQKIDSKFNDISLNINETNYLYDYHKYIKDNNLSIKEVPLLKEEITQLNKEFIYNQSIFKYKKFIKILSYKLPSKERLEIIKKIILEESDYIIFTQVFMTKIKLNCKIRRNNYQKEKDKFLISRKHISQFKPKSIICKYDKLTVNGKKKYVEHLEKRIFKYFFLQKLYLNKNTTMELIKKKLEFYMSKEYQDFYPLRVKITELLLDIIEEKEKIININKEEKNPFNISNEKESVPENNLDDLDFLDN